MASLAQPAAITQVRRIGENRSDGVVMVKKCHFDGAAGGGGVIDFDLHRYKPLLAKNRFICMK